MDGNPYFRNLVLGMHMNGVDNGASFVDVRGHTVSRYGNTVTKTGVKKFGSSSAYFDGASDYLAVAHAEDLLLGGDLTIAFQVCVTAFPSQTNYPRVFAKAEDAAGGMIVYYNSIGNLYLKINGSLVIPIGSLSLNVFKHIEICRAGSTIYTFADGALGGTGTYSGVLGSSNTIFIGSSSTYTGSSTYCLTGYLDEVEIYRGLCRHTANFTPPSEQFVDHMVQASGIVKDVSGALTSKPVHLHRQSDGALAGVAISDAVTGAFTIDALDTSAHYATCIYSNTEPAITHHNIIPV